jgi:GNAT superfamily N-acetyltransferase
VTPERVGLEAYAAAYGVSLDRGVAVLRVDEAPETPMVNRLVGLGEEEPATEAALDAGIAALEGTTYYVSRSPSARPAELDDWLRARGFEPGWGWMQFTRPGELAPPEARGSLRVVEVDGEERATDFARVVRTGYGLPEPSERFLVSGASAPGWTAFLALDGDEPAGAAAVWIGRDAAYLGFAATLAEHRGKGAQTSLLAARLDRAREAGCAVVVTETGEQRPDRPSNSYRNILRAGFREEHVVGNWIRAATS